MGLDGLGAWGHLGCHQLLRSGAMDTSGQQSMWDYSGLCNQGSIGCQGWEGVLAFHHWPWDELLFGLGCRTQLVQSAGEEDLGSLIISRADGSSSGIGYHGQKMCLASLDIRCNTSIILVWSPAVDADGDGCCAAVTRLVLAV